jgi:hypothetical protein
MRARMRALLEAHTVSACRQQCGTCWRWPKAGSQHCIHWHSGINYKFPNRIESKAARELLGGHLRAEQSIDAASYNGKKLYLELLSGFRIVWILIRVNLPRLQHHQQEQRQ